MTRRCRLHAPAALLVVGLAMPVWADLPVAFDRVSTDASLVIGVGNLGQAIARFDAMMAAFGDEAGEGGPLEPLKQIAGLPGVNADGSAALAIVGAIPEDGSEPPMVALVPVSNYAAFVQNFGGTGTGVEEVTLEDEPAFVKDAGGGYAIIGPDAAVVEGFDPAAGQRAEHERLIGDSGRAAADASYLVVIANLPALEPAIRQGIDQMKQGMGGMSAMMGPGAAEQLAMITGLAERVAADGQRAVLGLASDASGGMALHMAAQFKEGSSSAAYFTGPGQAGELGRCLPNQPFLFALAVDHSSPGMKQFMADWSANNAGGAGMFGIDPAAFIESTSGMSFFMGTSPGGLMGGGLMLNSLVFLKSNDPAACAKGFQDANAKLNGQTIEGMNYATTYTAGGGDVEGQKVDTWSIKFKPAPDNPQGMQVQQAMMLMFGPSGGPGGYVVPTKAGLVVTMGKNSNLVKQAVAAESGNGLTSAASVKVTADALPAGRVFEAYVGVKDILDMVLPMAAMMTGAPVEVQIPPDLPPIGVGASAAGGGVHAALVMPAAVLKTIRDLQAAFENAQGGAPDVPDEEEGGQPRF